MTEVMETIIHWVAPNVDLTGEYWVRASDYMREHFEIPIIASLIYVAVVFGGQRLMRDREPFQLKLPLFIWNVILAVFSGAGVYYVVPPMYRHVMTNGISADMCDYQSEVQNPWVFFFILSKIWEFGDTLFLVLRKRPVIFLHWYHHVLTCLYCWVAWSYLIENGGWFAAMNLVVHTIMYSYYALCAIGVRFPKVLRIMITSLQLVQMVAGTAIVTHNYFVCNTYPLATYLGLGMYLSYFILFAYFFYKSYMQPSGTKKKKAKGPEKPTTSSKDVVGNVNVKADLRLRRV